MGTRLSLSSLFDHREATITNLHDTYLGLGLRV